MYVPNYIPEPLEVPGNATEERYSARLAFIRRVEAWHAATVVLIAVLVQWVVAPPRLIWAAAATLACLIALAIVRIAFRGRPFEARLSAAFLPVLLAVVALLAAALARAGIPVWSVTFGLAAALVYAYACGRDFSFVGQYFLALIASSVGIAAVVLSVGLSKGDAAWALGLNAGFLTYFVYDLASMLSRRRIGEEPAAIVDLYRDVLNVFGYFIRVIRHWRKHRIWSQPR